MPVVCSACSRTLPETAFHSSQLQRDPLDGRRCQECFHRIKSMQRPAAPLPAQFQQQQHLLRQQAQLRRKDNSVKVVADTWAPVGEVHNTTGTSAQEDQDPWAAAAAAAAAENATVRRQHKKEQLKQQQTSAMMMNRARVLGFVATASHVDPSATVMMPAPATRGAHGGRGRAGAGGRGGVFATAPPPVYQNTGNVAMPAPSGRGRGVAAAAPAAGAVNYASAVRSSGHGGRGSQTATMEDLEAAAAVRRAAAAAGNINAAPAAPAPKSSSGIPAPASRQQRQQQQAGAAVASSSPPAAATTTAVPLPPRPARPAPNPNEGAPQFKIPLPSGRGGRGGAAGRGGGAVAPSSSSAPAAAPVAAAAAATASPKRNNNIIISHPQRDTAPADYLVCSVCEEKKAPSAFPFDDVHLDKQVLHNKRKCLDCRAAATTSGMSSRVASVEQQQPAAAAAAASSSDAAAKKKITFNPLDAPAVSATVLQVGKRKKAGGDDTAAATVISLSVPTKATCAACQKTLDLSRFARQQLKKDAANRRCIACTSATADNLVCGSCGQSVPRSSFSKSQLKCSVLRRCYDCVASGAGAGMSSEEALAALEAQGEDIGEDDAEAAENEEAGAVDEE